MNGSLEVRIAMGGCAQQRRFSRPTTHTPGAPITPTLRALERHFPTRNLRSKFQVRKFEFSNFEFKQIATGANDAILGANSLILHDICMANFRSIKLC